MSEIVPTFIYKVKFDEFDELFKIFKKHLTIFTDEELITFTNQYINENEENNGEFISFKLKDTTISLLLLNIKKYTINTIKHELMHWIQFNFGKLYSEMKFENEIDLDIISHLKLTEEEFSYVFQSTEFYPIIYDLCYGLKKLYEKKYKNLSIDEYLDLIFKTCLTNNHNVINSELFLNYGEVNQDDLPIRIFIANYILNEKDNRIEKIIKSYFKYEK